MPSIVIVDDRVTNRRILSRLASELDSKPDVETFADPVLALEWLEHNEPDLVITDFKMPNLDGAEFVQSLRRLPTCSDVPVIVVTAYEDKKFRYEALNAGATDFLLSPVDHEEFRARARNLLTLRYQQCLLKRLAAQLQDKLERSNRLHSAALKESEEKLRLVMNTIPAMISTTNAEHRNVFMNNFQAWMLGIDPEEIVGKGAEKFMSETFAVRNHQLDQQVFKSGASLPAFEEEFHDATGRRRILLTTESPLRDSSGAVANVVSASVEISDRKAAELALIADPVSLRQGLLNVLAGAVKFTPPGGSVCVGAQLTEHGGLRITVGEQTGTATELEVPPSRDGFGQENLNQGCPGMDLDLQLSAAFMKMHDADFDVSSQKAEGTEVTITFPTLLSARQQETNT